MRRYNLIVLLIAVVMGGAAALLARNWVQAQAVPASAQTIVVAKAKLGFGTELTEDNVVELEWAAKALPDGAFGSKKALFKDGRRVALAAVDRNEPILASKVTGGGERGSLSALVAPGFKAVTVRVDDVRGVAGFVLPGDRVDVVLIRSEQSREGNVSSSDILLQDVKVLAVDQLVSERQETAKLAKAVTLEVSTEDAQKILLASNVGHLSLILRHMGETHTEAVARVTEFDLTASGKPHAATVPASQIAPATAIVDIVRGTKRESYNVKRTGG